jgi:hypothetical protein
MRRKLISHEVFDKINEGSAITVENELAESEDVLARALSVEGLRLFGFNESTVTYETLDKCYIRAAYSLKDNNVIFENIEELVLDEASSIDKRKDVVRKMLDEVLNKNEAKANEYFKEYVSLPAVRRAFLSEEQIWVEPKNKPKKRRGPQSATVGRRRALAKKRHQQTMSPSEKKRISDLRKKLRSQYGANVRIHIRSAPQVKRKMKEWLNLAENVMNYVDFQEFGPTVRESELRHDDKGNVVAVKIPNIKARNEGKVLSFNWKTLSADNVVLRAKMKNLAEDSNFCKAVADLKRCNNLSDNEKLQTVLEAIVTRWSDVIFLTHNELTEQISNALETIGQSNYDDQICEFMAEGILRTAVGAYEDRVNKIIKTSGVKYEATDDLYADFQNVAQKFFGFLDENTKLEMQVFVDLYNTLVEVNKLANDAKDDVLRTEVHAYLRELKAIIDQESKPSIELVAEVAEWLDHLVETNLESEDWDVSNTPHMTISGDHPEMAKKARQPYSPANDFSGDWGDPAPVSDGKSYKGGLADEMRGDAWGNWTNSDTWPALDNPYVPKAGEWTMPKEKGADKDGTDDWSRFQSKDTWPNLENPYVPKEAGGPGGEGYKTKSDNLVVDK